MRSDTKHVAPCGSYSKRHCRMYCEWRMDCDRLSTRVKMARRRAQKIYNAWMEKARNQ